MGAPLGREAPLRGPGDGTGKWGQCPCKTASRLAHSHQPSQRVSNTRSSAYRLGSQRAPRAPRVPGAPGTLEAQTSQARQVRHVLRVGQVYHVLQPRQARHVRGKVISGCPRMSHMSSQSVCVLFLSGMDALRAASNVPAPLPPLSKTNAEWSRGACACSRFGGKLHFYCFLSGMVGLRAASNMTAPPPSLSKTNAKWSRGARACSRFGGKVHYVFVLTGMLCVCVWWGEGGALCRVRPQSGGGGGVY